MLANSNSFILLFCFCLKLSFILNECTIFCFIQGIWKYVAMQCKQLCTEFQFVEIKGSLFKKIDKGFLYHISCSDVKERFLYIVLLAIVFIRNMTEFSWDPRKYYRVNVCWLAVRVLCSMKLCIHYDFINFSRYLICYTPTHPQTHLFAWQLHVSLILMNRLK
jgi:hypothetical protein